MCHAELADPLLPLHLCRICTSGNSLFGRICTLTSWCCTTPPQRWSVAMRVIEGSWARYSGRITKRSLPAAPSRPACRTFWSMCPSVFARWVGDYSSNPALREGRRLEYFHNARVTTAEDEDVEKLRRNCRKFRLSPSQYWARLRVR